MIEKYILTVFLTFSPLKSIAETTGVGKIIYTQGHTNPSCRIVKHKETTTGRERFFRLADVPTDDDIGAVALSALIANRDVTIYFESNQTSGCGKEPKIIFITVY